MRQREAGAGVAAENRAAAAPATLPERVQCVSVSVPPPLKIAPPLPTAVPAGEREAVEGEAGAAVHAKMRLALLPPTVTPPGRLRASTATFLPSTIIAPRVSVMVCAAERGGEADDVGLARDGVRDGFAQGDRRAGGVPSFSSAVVVTTMPCNSTAPMSGAPPGRRIHARGTPRWSVVSPATARCAASMAGLPGSGGMRLRGAAVVAERGEERRGGGDGAGAGRAQSP